MPALHVTDVALHLLVEIFDTVGRFQAPSQLLKQAEPMELGGRLRKGQNLLITLFSHAHADNHLLAGHVLSVRPGCPR